MKCAGLLGVIAFFFLSATTHAQSAPPPPQAAEPAPVTPDSAEPEPEPLPEPPPVPAPPPCVHCPPRIAHRQMVFRTASERHDFLSAHDPEYSSAHAWRRGGTALAIAGGSLGMVLASIGVVSVLMESTLGHYEEDNSNFVGRTLLIGGLVTTAVSLAVGLPMATNAHGRMRAIRSRYPVVGVGFGDRSGSVQVGWNF